MTGTSKGLLLDTHVFLWWAEDVEGRVSEAVREAIATAPHLYVSIASAWELAIKVSSGKLRFDTGFRHAVEVNRATVLPVTLDHVERVATLPHHHGDPFDRMLAAQTMHEGLTLVTHDRAFVPYELSIAWA